MFVDSQLLFSDTQAVTAAAASTNLVDLSAIRDLGTGEPLFVVVGVDVALTDAGSDSTVTVTVETDDNSGFSSATTSQTLFTIPAVSAAGYQAVARIQPDGANERYIRLKYTPNNGNLSTGSFTAFIAKDIQKYVSYADGITIS